MGANSKGFHHISGILDTSISYDRYANLCCNRDNTL